MKGERDEIQHNTVFSNLGINVLLVGSARGEGLAVIAKTKQAAKTGKTGDAYSGATLLAHGAWAVPDHEEWSRFASDSARNEYYKDNDLNS